MSTNDVPGANPINRDVLAMGCWAEHADGSMIFVESTEGGRVVYCMFDRSKTPIVEYRDAMPETEFKKLFTWNDNPKSRASNKAGDKAVPNLKWTWHDKTPFPWDLVIKAGAQDGLRFASAADTITAAQRVAESLKLRAQELHSDRYAHMREQIRGTVSSLRDKLRRAVNELRK